ncbi:MAG: hypothetical protein CM15mP83_3860 [Flavobacteriaceae bacterium]|nr:MAG: hypothetical protein CM15mP83_3860 [Flavobacteriaceae bacterium]
MANLTGPLGLNEEAHILEKIGAKMTMKSELRTETKMLEFQQHQRQTLC